MKTNNLLKTQLLKVTLITLIIAAFQSSAVSAQGLKAFARKYSLGFEGAFGVKSFEISSNIAKIDGLNVAEEGGTIGVVAGSKIARIRIKQGYYYSSSVVTQTVDEIRSAVTINFYPLDLFLFTDNARLAPYITVGAERNLFKMYGFYGNEASASHVNYSVSEAPYLGKISTIQASVGAGMEYRIKVPRHFVNFFGEVRYGKNMKTSTSSSLFGRTSFSDQMAVSVGVCFGYSN